MDLNQVGNLLISYTDKFRYKFYLTSQLQFSKNITEACLFYLLKSDGTPICSGDHVTINTANKVLVLLNTDDSGKKSQLMLIDRNIAHRYNKSEFIVMTGTDHGNETEGPSGPEKIEFDSKIFFIIDQEQKLALRFYYSLSLGSEQEDVPILTYGSYDEGREIGIDIFQFTLTKGINIQPGENEVRAEKPHEKLIEEKKSFDNYKGILLIIILLVILVIFLMINEKMRSLNV